MRPRVSLKVESAAGKAFQCTRQHQNRLQHCCPNQTPMKEQSRRTRLAFALSIVYAATRCSAALAAAAVPPTLVCDVGSVVRSSTASAGGIFIDGAVTAGAAAPLPSTCTFVLGRGPGTTVSLTSLDLDCDSGFTVLLIYGANRNVSPSNSLRHTFRLRCFSNGPPSCSLRLSRSDRGKHSIEFKHPRHRNLTDAADTSDPSKLVARISGRPPVLFGSPGDPSYSMTGPPGSPLKSQSGYLTLYYIQGACSRAPARITSRCAEAFRGLPSSLNGSERL